MSDSHCPRAGKIGYDTQRAAGLAKRAVEKVRNHQGLHVYRCPICGKWHLGRDRKLGKSLKRFRS